MEVTLTRVPGTTSTLEVRDDATVADVLNSTGSDVSGSEAIKVNGLTATISQTLADGDRVIIAAGAKGNS